jgi:hypothetical protein
MNDCSPVNQDAVRSPAHYSIAQILEMHDALQKITDESERKNVSLRTLVHEHNAQRLTQKSLTKKKDLEA